jgi:hypothetical protein
VAGGVAARGGAAAVGPGALALREHAERLQCAVESTAAAGGGVSAPEVAVVARRRRRPAAGVGEIVLEPDLRQWRRRAGGEAGTWGGGGDGTQITRREAIWAARSG